MARTPTRKRSPRPRAPTRGAPRRPPARGAPAPSPVTPTPPRPGGLTEDPHAHIVCRNCGRISSVGLSQLDLYGLEVLAERRPAGWTAQAVTFSITGFCPACRGRRPG